MMGTSNGQTPNNVTKTTAPIWFRFTAMRNNTLSKVRLRFFLSLQISTLGQKLGSLVDRTRCTYEFSVLNEKRTELTSVFC